MPATTTTVDTFVSHTSDAAAIDNLKVIVAAYVAKHNMSVDPAAAIMAGAPFELDGKVHVQLRGRTGQGLLTGRVEVRSGVQPWLNTQIQCDAGAMRDALLVLGFTRKPVSYRHPVRGQSSASYWIAPASVLA